MVSFEKFNLDAQTELDKHFFKAQRFEDFSNYNDQNIATPPLKSKFVNNLQKIDEQTKVKPALAQVRMNKEFDL